MRRPKPFFRKQTKSWYVQLGKKQINLGRDEAKAVQKYHQLMANQEHGEPSGDETVSKVFNRYLGWVNDNRAPATFEKARRHLRRFVMHVGTRLKVSQLKRHHVQHWIDADYADTSSTYQNTAMTHVVTALNWAADLDYIAGNPIRGLKKPAPTVREFFLTPKQWKAILASIGDQEFRDYFEFSVLSGVRPQEARIIEARHYSDSCLTLDRGESKGKKRQRVIFLPQAAAAIVDRLIKLYPDGPIFRNTKGRPWTKDSINNRMARLKTKHKLPELCAYALRHSFAHAKLSQGVDAHLVSKLLGHADGRMLETRYGHVEKNKDVMLRAAEGNPAPIPIVETQPGSATSIAQDQAV